MAHAEPRLRVQLRAVARAAAQSAPGITVSHNYIGHNYIGHNYITAQSAPDNVLDVHCVGHALNAHACMLSCAPELLGHNHLGHKIYRP